MSKPLVAACKWRACQALCDNAIRYGASMKTGMVFDIREFSIHDGPGLRTSVFLKGCPLRCAWCHNPEGLSPEPQLLETPGGTRVCGRVYTAAELAERLNRQAQLLRAAEGGVTFSGGEPLLQAAFLGEVLDRLDRLHVVLDTSGHGDEQAFAALAGRVDLVYFDLKLMDPELHRRYTGHDNRLVLANLARLATLATPCVIRVPLVPGVTDTADNLRAVAAAAAALPKLVRVDLLPYNRAAGGKYRACGMDFRPPWDESKPVEIVTAPFAALALPVKVN
jgi:pyruvate formate lyase activating enzyme